MVKKPHKTRHEITKERKANGNSILPTTRPSGIRLKIDKETLSEDELELIDVLENVQLSKPGRVPLDLDARRPKTLYEFVEMLGLMGCTLGEVCEYFGITRSALSVRFKKDEALERAFKLGQVKGVLGLRRAQYKSAQRGNPALLMWLGKQKLRQSERGELKESLQEGNLQLENLDRDELEVFKDLVKKARGS